MRYKSTLLLFILLIIFILFISPFIFKSIKEHYKNKKYVNDLDISVGIPINIKSPKILKKIDKIKKDKINNFKQTSPCAKNTNNSLCKGASKQEVENHGTKLCCGQACLEHRECSTGFCCPHKRICMSAKCECVPGGHDCCKNIENCPDDSKNAINRLKGKKCYSPDMTSKIPCTNNLSGNSYDEFKNEIISELKNSCN